MRLLISLFIFVVSAGSVQAQSYSCRQQNGEGAFSFQRVQKDIVLNHNQFKECESEGNNDLVYDELMKSNVLVTHMVCKKFDPPVKIILNWQPPTGIGQSGIFLSRLERQYNSFIYECQNN